MIPVECPECGHIQDAGSAYAPNNKCERCGKAMYGFEAHDPDAMIGLAVICTVGAWWLDMPK